MEAKVEGGNLIITLPIDNDGKVSSTGKTIVHASETKKTEVQVAGRSLTVSVNAYTPNPDKPKK